jgi:hypothetical protein
MSRLEQLRERVDLDVGRWAIAFAGFNFLFMGLDILMAHSVNEFGKQAEFVPLIFSAVAGPVALIQAIVRPRAQAWRAFFVLVLMGGIAVGLAGTWFHLDSHFLRHPSLKTLVYTAPIVAPLAYAGVSFVALAGLLDADSAWSRPRVLFLLAGGGFAGNAFLAVADHAQNGFFVPVEWSSVFAGFLGAATFIGLALRERPTRTDGTFALLVVLFEMGIGTLGFIYHLLADLNAVGPTLIDQFVFGAPVFAPLLFANLGLLGLLALMERPPGAARHA